MNFLDVQCFDVKEGRVHEFQKWMSENEEKIALECPDGCKYQGTFALVRSSDRRMGSFMTTFELDSYGAMDRFSEAMKEGGTFARLMDEMSEYVDQRNDANYGDMLGRRIADVAIWGE